VASAIQFCNSPISVPYDLCVEVRVSNHGFVNITNITVDKKL
jgi:hypothetical protein